MTANANEDKPRRERGSGGLWQVGRIWWIQFYSHGRRIRESSGSEREGDAKRLLRTRLSEVNQGNYISTGRLSYEDIRDAFLEDYEKKRRKSLRRDGEGKPLPLDKVERLNSFFAGFRVDEIDADALAKFTREMQVKGKKDSTINRSLSALRRMFHLARKQEKLKHVPPFDLLPEPKARQGFIDRAQYDALAKCLPDYLRLPLALGFFTGMRLGEILNLKWDQIDFLGSVITLRAGETKSGEGRKVPVGGELRALLQEQHSKRMAACDYVCFRLDRIGRAARIEGFRKAWYAACVKAGLGKMVPSGGTVKRSDRPHGRPKAKTVYEGLIFHDLRRSAVRNLVRAGVPQSVAMDISGHKTISVFKRYNITSEQDLQDAAAKLESYLGAKKNGASLVQIPDNSDSRKVLTN